jgi:fructose-1,6-bisphosphatase I
MTVTLTEHLDQWTARGSPGAPRTEIAAVVQAIAGAAVTLAERIALGPLRPGFAEVVGSNADGDAQAALDVEADRLFMAALRTAPVAVVGSEEHEAAQVLDEAAPLVVVIDPLDGSSNIETNLSVGTIFGILPMTGLGPDAVVLQAGRRLLAAGMVVYGPQTTLTLTLGEGTLLFTLDRRDGVFVCTASRVAIPAARPEFAINASNYRHWDGAIRAYIDDCIAGVTGPRGRNFNTRWLASLVAEASRILNRGGVFLYPADRRPGYERGRLRLIYEANPIAMLMEEAGGAATDGVRRIRDLVPQELHERTPLVFGSADKVERVARYYAGPPSTSERSPLFGQRGLFYHARG